MKKLIALSMALCALNASAKLASTDTQVKYAGDLAYSNFCEAVVKDDVNMLKRSVRSKIGEVATSSRSVLKKLIAADGMSCNGVDLISFSQQRKASAVFEYLTNIE